MATKDFYLFFKGTAGSFQDRLSDKLNGGRRTPAEGMAEFEDIPERVGFKMEKWAYTGSVQQDEGPTDALPRLLNNPEYVPGVSLLIIYGYSAGAKNALKLCRLFDQSNKDHPGRQITVDLLVTVDAAAWEDSDKIDRTVADCVKKCVNYYQTAAGKSGSHGGPSLGDPSKRTDTPRSEGHADINDAVRPEAKQAIRTTIREAAGVSLVGVWDVVIGDWRGAFEFTEKGDATWQETDPKRFKADAKKHSGTWWPTDEAEFKWEYADDAKGSKRTFVVRRPLGEKVRGNVLPAGRGFFDMTKR